MTSELGTVSGGDAEFIKTRRFLEIVVLGICFEKGFVWTAVGQAVCLLSCGRRFWSSEASVLLCTALSLSLFSPSRSRAEVRAVHKVSSSS